MPHFGVAATSGLHGGHRLPLISPAQTWALAAAVARELAFGLPATALEMRRWRAHAKRIPDPSLRSAALHALDHKRGYADGAVLIGIITPRPSRRLLQAHAALESIVDYLDNVSEAHPTHANGQQLHLAIVDAVDPTRPASARYYAHHPVREDGGYLAALLDTCRSACAALPSYPQLRPHLLREARRSRVLGLNHELDPELRDARLRDWAREEFGEDTDGLESWELSGAASATMHLHALLALAATPNVDDTMIAAVTAAHWPWIALAATLLDSLVDWAADHVAGAHCYLDHYPDRATALARIRQSIEIATARALDAPRGHRHAVIVACMISLYLSAPSARAPDLASRTAEFIAAGGPLVQLLVPVLRAWRIAYAQRE